MSNSDFWKNYKERKLISSDSRTYQAININTGKYEVIKEISKDECNINIEELKKERERMKNEENIVKINEIKEDNNIFYMIMDLYSYNLENYLKIRDKPLSINEIKEILLQLNKILKKLNEENIIYGNLKLSNILINLDEINKISLCYYDSIKFYKKLESSMSNKINYTISPEIIKDGIYNNNKSDIWSLGIIIYYMLTKKYLYEGKNEYQLYNNIISQNINDKLSENEELNDLLIKMLKININERISWEEYFNHPFFELDNYILCEYNIKKEDLNKDIQILNYLNEKTKEEIMNYYKEIGKTDYILEINEDEINSSICDLYLNNERINFSYKYKFEKEGKYSLKILFKRSIKNMSYMFNQCSSLTSLNLSNFNTNNVQNMSFCLVNVLL